MIFIVTRQHGTNFAVWPFASVEKANAFIDKHVVFRSNSGAEAITEYTFEPAPVEVGKQVRVGGSETKPVMTDAPELTCVVREVVLIEDEKQLIYRVIRSPIQE